MAKKPVKIGKKVKDFTLESSRGRKVSTASIKDKKILLSFHPLAWTSVCARQMQALDAAYPEFERLKTVPLGISVDSAPSKAAWAKALRLNRLHLLADFWPHGKISKKFGVFDKKAGTSLRANIVISKKGKVIFSKIYPMNQLPDLKAIFKFLKEKMHHEGPESGKTEKGKPAAVKPKITKSKTVKPAIKPTVKPAEKPADLPVEKPEEKPSELPAEKPANKPEEKPPQL